MIAASVSFFMRDAEIIKDKAFYHLSFTAQQIIEFLFLSTPLLSNL